MSISPCRGQGSAARPSDGLPRGEFGVVGRLGDVIEHLPGLVARLAEQSGGPLRAARGVFNKEINLSPQVPALEVKRRHRRVQGGQMAQGLDPAFRDPLGIVRPGGEGFLSDLSDHVAGLIGRLQSCVGTPHGIFSFRRIERHQGAPLLRQVTGRLGSLAQNISPGFGYAMHVVRSGSDRPLGRLRSSLGRAADTLRTGFGGTPRVFCTGVNNASASFLCLGSSVSRGVTSLASIRHSSSFWIRADFTWYVVLYFRNIFCSAASCTWMGCY